MTAATENAKITTVQGNKRVILANLTWDNTYTFATGLHNIDAMLFTPTTAAAFGLTKSGGTVTLVSGGALTGDIRVEGV